MTRTIFAAYETEGKYAGKMGWFATEPIDGAPRFMEVMPCSICGGDKEPQPPCGFCKDGWVLK